jgi:hypothetical protein
MLAPFSDSPNKSWLNIDIAVEIINRMIAEQMKGLHDFCSPREDAGISHEEYKNDSDYQAYMIQIKNFRNEIRQLYKGENVEKTLNKVENEYAPYIKNMFNSTQQYA